jgi:hypothetical protein
VKEIKIHGLKTWTGMIGRYVIIDKIIKFDITVFNKN